MTARIVAWCTRHPWIVLVIALALGAGGELARRSLSRDVIPDLSDPQVVLVADWMGHPVPEVASLGGDVQQVLVETRPYDLRSHKVAFSDVVAALHAALGPAPASQPRELAAIEALPVPPTGTPLRDVARIRLADDMPYGVADLGGGNPAIGGIVIAERDA